MANVFSTILSSVGDYVQTYDSSVWGPFFQRMMNDLSGMYSFSAGGNWGTSMLEKSAPKIRETMDEVNDVFNERNFIYFDGEGGLSHTRDAVISVADPDSSKGVPYKNWSIPINGDTVNRDGKLGVYLDSTPYNVPKINTDAFFTDITQYENGETSISRANLLFKRSERMYASERFNTIVSRFHTYKEVDQKESVGNTSYTDKFGMSHGRNLLSTSNVVRDGYDDPYCRVWTWRYQYRKLSDTIRPLSQDDAALDRLYSDDRWSEFRSPATDDGFESGASRLMRYGVMYDNNKNRNGLVNITPQKGNLGNGTEGRVVDVKKCMFSIENLAWKDVKNRWIGDDGIGDVLSEEQMGPLGGRIMWFPPYGLSFNENTQTSWNKHVFIGRGEPMYTYSNTERTGSLSFMLLIDHPAILDYWEHRDGSNPSGTLSDESSDNREQKLLRFFAGCDKLSAKGNTAYIDEGDDNEGDGRNNEPDKIKDTWKKVQFYIYYPNNYSGVDDLDTDINPIKYLLNGVGTQLQYDTATRTESKITDIGSLVLYRGSQVGGYETRADVGVSVVKSGTTDNNITTVTIGGESVLLRKQFDEKLLDGSINKSDTRPSGEAEGDTWDKKRYYYRCDKAYLGQVLVGKGASSYIDSASFMLNTSGYRRPFVDDATVHTAKIFDVSKEELACTYSLLDVYLATGRHEGDKYLFTEGVQYSQSKVDELKSVFSGQKGKIVGYKVIGRASSQGYNKLNRNLSANRARTADWFINTDGIIPSDATNFSSSSDSIPDVTKNEIQDNPNIFKAKADRCAKVEIYYEPAATEDASGTQVGVNESGAVVNDRVVVTNNVSNERVDGNIPTARRRSSSARPAPSKRYDNEYNFFKKLTQNEDMLTSEISKKITNFNPVFHSVSPEGFNARLTFLEQCSRQGPTYGGNDTKGYNATNLSFGRPPICVLRIGDFYNTKIVINSIQKEFDQCTWDLNDEGIGVMPMIAKITMNFSFIGGSDLGGPIQRLQNATSFNYYANTGVYDDRTDEITYENGAPATFKAFLPN